MRELNRNTNSNLMNASQFFSDFLSMLIYRHASPVSVLAVERICSELERLVLWTADSFLLARSLDLRGTVA